MSRVKIKFPAEKPLYTALIPLRITDINYGGHMGNDALLSIIHESRMQLLAQWQYNELDAGGNGLIMADVMIAYRGEAFHGDVLKINIYSTVLTERSFDLLYHITTEREGVEIEIAQAKTGMVCFDYQRRKIALLTAQLKSHLEGMES